MVKRSIKGSKLLKNIQKETKESFAATNNPNFSSIIQILCSDLIQSAERE